MYTFDRLMGKAGKHKWTFSGISHLNWGDLDQETKGQTAVNSKRSIKHSETRVAGNLFMHSSLNYSNCDKRMGLMTTVATSRL